MTVENTDLVLRGVIGTLFTVSVASDITGPWFETLPRIVHSNNSQC